MVFWAIKPGI